MSDPHRRGRLLAAAVLSLGIVLAGCATPGPVATTPVAEPTATPTAEPVAQPGPRTPLGCDEIFDSAEIETLLVGSAALQPRIPSPSAAAVAQSGVLICSWSRADQLSSLFVGIAPAEILGEVPVVYGGTCDSADGGAYCGGGVAAGPFTIQSVASITGPGADVQGDYDAVIASASARLANGGILPAWESPERSTAAPGTCDSLASSDITAALGALSGPEYSGDGDGLSAASRGSDVAGYGTCMWQVPNPDFPPPVADIYGIDWTPGGAWAWPYDAAEPITVAGADKAVLICESSHCHVDAIVGETWVSGTFGDLDHDPAAIAANLAAIIPSLPVEAA